MEKTNQFLMIDYKILKINTITHNGKKYKFTDTLKNTYCYILGFEKRGKEAFPSYNKIADVFGITKGSAQDRINKLIEMGLVEKIEQWKGKQRFSNLYYALPINQESTSGRSYSENIGTRHQQPIQVKEVVIEDEQAPCKNHLEEFEPLETGSEDDVKTKSSFADELDKESSALELLINQTSFHRSQNKMRGFTIPDDEDQCPF